MKAKRDNEIRPQRTGVSVTVPPANPGLICLVWAKELVSAPMRPAPPESLRCLSVVSPYTHRRFKFEPTVCVGRDNGETTEGLRRDRFDVTGLTPRAVRPGTQHQASANRYPPEVYALFKLHSAQSSYYRPRIERAPLALLALLALALVVPGRAETPPAAIALSEIGAKATANCQGDALGVTARADGARLRCGFQKLEGHATSEGLWLESTKLGAAGRLRLTASDICRAGLSTLNSQPSTLLSASGTVSVHDKVVQFVRPGLTEEYSVSVDGVRQDLVIAEPLAGAGELRVELALSGVRAEAAAYGARLIFDGSGRALAYSRLRAEDAAGRELPACLEVLSADRLVVNVVDANATYPVRIDPTFSDADWVSLNPGVPGADGGVHAVAVDDQGNLYIAGQMSFVGTVAVNNIAKWDGTTWSALGTGLGLVPNDYVKALAISGTNLYAGGVFTTAGGVAATNIAKWDGSAWSALGSGLGGVVNALALNGTALYAGGFFTSAGGVAATNIAKWDGSAWSALGSGLDAQVTALGVGGSGLYAGGYFTKAGAVAANRIAKWDGSDWSALGSGIGDGPVYALAVSGTNLYAAGFFTSIAKWDGSVWSTLGSGMNNYAYALAVSGTNLYVGGSFTNAGGVAANRIAQWDGRAWSALGSGVGTYYAFVSALAASGTNLYAGGEFTTAGGVTAANIAKWSGSAWSALGSGISGGHGAPYMNARVNSLAAGGTNLYAGGEFTSAGGVTANGIAVWDGKGWAALGSGMNSGLSSYGIVFALALNGSDLYAGGLFQTAGGVAATNIARWDGRTWSPLGPGLNSVVNALALSGTNLYAGGYFTLAGGLTVNRVARWNGSAWSTLGSGMNDSVTALAASGSKLYAGGCFTRADGRSATNLAVWDGSAWSALGFGLNAQVTALAVSGTDLYAGGWFTKAGWVTANRIARWNGSWSALSSGMNDNVYALAVSGSDLYAGGSFTAAGGVAASSIAKWNGTVWSALGSGVSCPAGSSVNALAADGSGHLFVGGDFYFAGQRVSPFIAQANVIPPGGAIQDIHLGTGSVTLNFLGLPSCLYDLQRATDVRFTQNQTTLLTTNPPAADGRCCYTDPSPPSTAAFYRLRRQQDGP
jgi:hypothetical protein